MDVDDLRVWIKQYTDQEKFKQTVDLAYLFYLACPTERNFGKLIKAFAAAVLETCITDDMQAEESDLVSQLFRGVN